jgi:hypothetical protein
LTLSDKNSKYGCGGGDGDNEDNNDDNPEQVRLQQIFVNGLKLFQ